MAADNSHIEEYFCPGESRPISRAVHLGRLAAFFPACRQCPHRHDTGSLSPKQKTQLAEAVARSCSCGIFHEESVGGVYLNEFTLTDARRVAFAFAEVLKTSGLVTDFADATVVSGNDARSISAELTATLAETIRMAGCKLIDIGPATSASLAFAVKQFQATAGILVGNSTGKPENVDISFWLSGPRPLSDGASLAVLASQYNHCRQNTARSWGTLTRVSIDSTYLAGFTERFHALRPLNIQLDSASKPLVAYLEKLISRVACRIVAKGEAAHLRITTDGNGECCNVFDEQGRPVSSEQLLLLLARDCLAFHDMSVRPVIIVGEDVSRKTVRQIEKFGGHVKISVPRREHITEAMLQERAIFGADSKGRFWHLCQDVPLPDTLATIACLLNVLSRSDESLSAILDREVGFG